MNSVYSSSIDTTTKGRPEPQAQKEVSDVLSYQDERIAHLVRLCARGFNRSLARRLAQHKITFGQWVFLRILWKREGLTLSQLSEAANLTAPTTHTALTKMEKLDLIRRRKVQNDGRRQFTFMTDKGRKLQKELEPLAVDANEAALAGIPEEQREVLRTNLITILENLEKDEAEAEARGLKVPATRSNFGDS
ncbi:MarR family transcriptional regulator [Marivibrio halodurans]|uniref:MarR family transcriptional regulator n=1 Tax=Marivibrio halodurans TaxID=2039722 RepID=A0A8J7S2M3_9PROT|nr:MarR family transcriptional regulator [Marivibrio halodurans]MBP5857443.1 MarR family transcriptional regulator [Marivibrio halodurans]